MTWPAVGDLVRLRTSATSWLGRGVITEAFGSEHNYGVLSIENTVGTFNYVKGHLYGLPITDILGFPPFERESEWKRADPRRSETTAPHPDSVPRIYAPNGCMVLTANGWVLIETGSPT